MLGLGFGLGLLHLPLPLPLEPYPSSPSRPVSFQGYARRDGPRDSDYDERRRGRGGWGGGGRGAPDAPFGAHTPRADATIRAVFERFDANRSGSICSDPNKSPNHLTLGPPPRPTLTLPLPCPYPSS